MQEKVAILPAGVAGLAEAVARGFRFVELEALEDRPAAHGEALADAGVYVVCVRLCGAPCVADINERRRGLQRLRRQVDDGARLGAKQAFLFVGEVSGAAAQAFFAEGLGLLNEHARGRMMWLAIAPLSVALAQREALGDLELGFAAEGDEEEAALQAGRRLTYVRRPGKPLQATLDQMDYRGFVAVDLHSPHTSSSTSSAT